MPSRPQQEKKWLWCIMVTPTSMQDNCGTKAKEHYYPGSSSLTACYDVPAAVMPFVFSGEPTGCIITRVKVQAGSFV